MKVYKTEQIRNIALVSHNGAGKTTLVERLLFHTGVTTRMGNPQNGTAATDFEEEEIERKSSISTALAPIEWKDSKLNFLDTPGYADFVGEVNAALKVADSSLILVEAIGGVEVGTELVWQYSANYNLPRMVLFAKMDRENVRAGQLFDNLKNNLLGNFVQLQLPIGEGPSFRGVIDLITQKAFMGEKGDPAAIPADMSDEVEEARTALLEAVAEQDEELLDKYFSDGDLSQAEIITTLKAAISAGDIVPVLYSAAQTGAGIVPMLDLLQSLMPAPNQRNFMATTPAGDSETHPVSDTSPLAAFVFKTREDVYGKMAYLRVFGGHLQADSRVWNVNRNQEIRIGTLNVLRGKESIGVSTLHAGDIGAAVKLGDTSTNNTLCDRGHQLVIEAIAQPEPIVSVAIHPVSQSDTAKLSSSLHRLTDEDPTLRWGNEPATREIILYGMGNTHLDIAVKKAQSKFGLHLTTTVPKIPYRETITRTNSAEYTHKKQTGGAGQYARVFLRVESLSDDQEFEFTSEIFGGSISGPFVAAVEKGCRQALEQGVLAGFPMRGVKAIVYDGKEHPVDSKEIAFQVAGREGFKIASLGAGPVLLEPISEATIIVPADNMGDIMGDMNTRRAKVLGMNTEGNKSVITVEVPLASMQTYSADLRSMTQGRGIYSLKFLRYGRVPANLQEQIVAEHKREMEKEKAG